MVIIVVVVVVDMLALPTNLAMHFNPASMQYLDATAASSLLAHFERSGTLSLLELCGMSLRYRPKSMEELVFLLQSVHFHT